MSILVNKRRGAATPQNHILQNNHLTTMSSPSQEPPMTLAQLISMQSWHEVHSSLLSRPTESIVIDDRMAVTSSNILHFACRFQAPLSIVRLLVSKYPSCVMTPDALGRFPIHVAAKYGASPMVIHFLICEHFAASGVPDDSGRAPVHYVGRHYAQSHPAQRSSKHVTENILQVVNLFKAAAPESFNLEDNDGCNAIEYALMGNADLKVVKAMQRAARDDWRELSQKHQVLSHDERSRLLERTASEQRHILTSDYDGKAKKGRSNFPSAA